VHDVGRDPDGGALYIALEHLKGRTLAEATDGGRSLAWREATRLLAQVARALHHAHGHGIVHRDMKPANVMVLESGEAKIMDFGIAKIEASLHHLTSPGEFLGTPLYMAPEQANGGAVTPRTDIFALGAIGFTLLTGRPAFIGDTVARIVMRVVGEDPGPPSRINPSVPPPVDGIVMRALSKDPSSRYPDAQGMAEDLEAVLEGHTPPHLATDATASGAMPTGMELVVADDDPVQAAFHALVADAPPDTQTMTRGPGSSSPAASLRSPGGWKRTLARRALLVALGVAGGAAVTHYFTAPAEDQWLVAPSRTSSPPAELGGLTATPSPEDSSPETPEASSAGGQASSTEPGQLAIDFEHSVRSGLLRVWLDEELIVEQRLAGQASKKGLVFTVRKGSYKDVLEVPPGRRVLRVQVAWDDNEKTERIVGTFKPGATRRLLVRLGGRLRKGLSLEWE
ncbi:MAG TPA: serine/threonine-protein kinase, partial [Vicinamibacteria bacterium]